MGLSASSAIGGGRWMPFRNVSGETIPAYACVQSVGVELLDGQYILQVSKPNDKASTSNLFFSGKVDIDPDEYGACTADLPAWALLDTTSMSAIIGDAIGPKTDTWGLISGNGMFEILGRAVGSSGGTALIRLSDKSLTTGPGGNCPNACFNCPPWDCADDTVTFADVACGPCTKTPDFFVFDFPATCTCCDGRVGGPVILERTESSCIWESPTFTCSTTGGSCGTARWKWNKYGSAADPANCGQVRYATRIVDYDPLTPCGYALYQWDEETQDWYTTGVNGGNCAMPPCTPATKPPFDGLYDGQLIERHCYEYEWYLAEDNCNCGGGIPDPPSRPATENDEEWIACTSLLAGGCICGEGTGDWEMIASLCTCGSPAKPKYEGDHDGQTVDAPCSGDGSGYDGTAKWRLTIDSTPRVQLIAPDDSVIIRYDVKTGRTMCCECATVFDFTGPCGPFDCAGWPDQICVKPYWPPKDCSLCPDLADEYSVAITCFKDVSINSLNYYPANGTFSFTKFDEVASVSFYKSTTFTLYFGSLAKTCYWEMRLTCNSGFTTGEIGLVGYDETIAYPEQRMTWGTPQTGSSDGGDVFFHFKTPAQYDSTQGLCRGGRYCSLDTEAGEFEMYFANHTFRGNFFGDVVDLYGCTETRDLYDNNDNPFVDETVRLTITPV